MIKPFKTSTLVFLFIVPPLSSTAQYGYVKLGNDSIIRGFIRPFKEVATNQDGLEIWATKKDRSPKRIFKRDMTSYAIGNDSVKVIHDFTPFPGEELYFEYADAFYVEKGKLNLFIIKKIREFMPVPVGGGLLVIPKDLGKVSYIYIVEDERNNRFIALPPKKDELHESLLNFFSESFISRYEQKFGEIKYKTLPKLIEFYNSKN